MSGDSRPPFTAMLLARRPHHPATRGARYGEPSPTRDRARVGDIREARIKDLHTPPPTSGPRRCAPGLRSCVPQQIAAPICDTCLSGTPRWICRLSPRKPGLKIHRVFQNSEESWALPRMIRTIAGPRSALGAQIWAKREGTSSTGIIAKTSSESEVSPRGRSAAARRAA